MFEKTLVDKILGKLSTAKDENEFKRIRQEGLNRAIIEFGPESVREVNDALPSSLALMQMKK